MVLNGFSDTLSVKVDSLGGVYRGPKEFRRGVITVARRGEARITQIVRASVLSGRTA